MIFGSPLRKWLLCVLETFGSPLRKWLIMCLGDFNNNNHHNNNNNNNNNNNSINNNNERISRALFHVKHAQLR